MIAVALGWQMYDLTSSAWNLGLVGLVQFLPALALTVPAGLLVDSVDRRKVLAASLAMQGVAGAVLGWGSFSGWVERDVILAVCVLIGIARALQMPSQQAIIPSLVPTEDLPRALAVNASMNKMSTICGPALGGILYAGGPALAYGLCAVMFLISMVLALLVAVPRLSRDPEALSWGSLLAGIGFIRASPVVLGAMSLDMFAVLLGSTTALLPIFAKDILQTGPWGLGVLRAAPALGGLFMTVLIVRWPMGKKVGHRMFIAVALYGISTIAFSFCTHLIWSVAALIGIGAADVVSTVLRHSVVQVETDDALRGRVGAAHATSIAASNQLGQFRAGVSAELLGPAGAVLVGGVSTLLVAGMWARLFPELLKRDRLFR
jgi:MFS family permease